MSLFSDLIGDNGSNDTIKKALGQINEIGVPTAESMQVKLQQLVAQGVLTPEQAQAALVNGNAYDKVGSDNTGMDSEQSALGSLQNVVNNKGMDAGEQADLAKVLSELNTQQRGSKDAILQNAAERGALTSGMTTAAQLASDQGLASTANSNALNANAAAQQRMLQAMSSLGSLGGQVQGQQYQAGANQASAANAIQQFNAQQQQNTNQYNTTNRNQAQATNLNNAQNISNQNVANNNTNAVRNADLIHQNFNDKLAKAGAAAGESNTLANLQQSQANQGGQLLGGLIGGAGQIGAAYASPMKAAHGGVVPGHAPVPGNSPANDIVPAKLSPGEVVLPRTAVQHGPAGVMSFLQRMKTPGQGSKPPMHPKDVATVLEALSHVREQDDKGMCHGGQI